MTDPEHLDRWHTLWIEHLEAQRGLNPNHPSGAGDLDRYRRAARDYQRAGGTGPGGGQHLWHGQIEAVEAQTRHDLVAALQVFNARAGVETAHMGLTSCDITDVANQMRLDSGFWEVLSQVRGVIYSLSRTMVEHAAMPLVARTHGQPAQLTTYDHRIATVLGPLCDWYDRAARAEDEYPMRPPHGAVGTAADLSRVLMGGSPKAPTAPPGATGSASDAPAGTEAPPAGPEVSETARDRWEAALEFGAKLWQDLISITRLSPDDRDAYERLKHMERSAKTWGKTIGLATNPATGELALVLVDPLTEHRSPQYDTGYRVDGTPPPDGVEVRTDPREPAPYSPPDSTGSVTTGVREPAPYSASETLDLYTAQLQARLGFSRTMDVTRQVYHRSYDLHIAGLLAELASIAQTYATDRRLEAMLGLGAEAFINGQVGSSSMPHKRNPITAERICALAVVTRSHLGACAEMAGMEWLEGDVSTSAARRLVLPGMIQTAQQLVQNWLTLVDGWEVNVGEIHREMQRWLPILASGALMQAAIEAGLGRDQAHQILSDTGELWLRATRQQVQPQHMDEILEWAIKPFVDRLMVNQSWPLDYDQSRQLIHPDRLVGDVAAQVEVVRQHAEGIVS